MIFPKERREYWLIALDGGAHFQIVGSLHLALPTQI